MPKGVNKTFLLGHCGKDPEVRTTNGGTIVASFSLATSDRRKDGRGEWQDTSEWHNLIAFGRTAEIVRDYVHKGSQLYLEGKLQTRSWDDKESGQKRYKTEILINELTLLGGKPGERQQTSGDIAEQRGRSYDYVAENGADPSDVPF